MRRLRWLLLALGLALLVRHWVWMPTLVIGESMVPTLHDGQFGGVNKLTYRFHPPRRGDVVVVRTRAETTIKRIIGLPGEDIALRRGVFYVNGQPLAEPYVQFPGEDTIAHGRLGTNSFLIVGDNRPDSILAVVNRKRIVGLLMFW